MFPAVTAFYAAVLALVFVALSGWVIAARTKFRVTLGDGGEETLRQRIRAHANFAEYVPLALLLLAALEGSGAGRVSVQVLLPILLLARLMHPIGMVAPDASTRQMVFRGAGMVGTFGVLVVSSLLLLARML